MAFATLLDLNGIRYKTAIQLTMALACKPPQDTQHIPRIPHADKAYMRWDPLISEAETQILITRLVRKSPRLTTDMRGRVDRLLTRNDQRVYAEQLERDLAEGVITATQKASNWTKYMQLTMEAKRHEANLIRTRLGRQLVPWGFGQPPIVQEEMALNTTRGTAARRTRKKRRSQAPPATPRGHIGTRTAQIRDRPHG